jgi:hypothetical protein
VLNTYAVDDAFVASDGDDQWGSVGCDTYSTDSTDSFDDCYINSICTVCLPTLSIIHSHCMCDHVSLFGGADTMVLSTGWRFIEILKHHKLNIVVFDEADGNMVAILGMPFW